MSNKGNYVISEKYELVNALIEVPNDLAEDVDDILEYDKKILERMYSKRPIEWHTQDINFYLIKRNKDDKNNS